MNDTDIQHSTTTPAAAHSPLEVLLIFLKLGVSCFGGPIAHIGYFRDEFVTRRRWLDEQAYADLVALCQFLPGGNIINLSVAIGLHFRGIPGALASLTGLIAAPTAIVVLLGLVYDRFQNEPHIQHLFAGLAAAAAGLLVAMAAKIAWPIRRRPIVIAIALLCFIAIGWLRWPLLPTMLGLAALSILATWRLEP